MQSARENTDILNLFRNKSVVCICAPMVRYSKLEFRSLVRKYGVDLCFTPMIMADSFNQSIKARDNEFTTNKEDTPLIVQFAAKTVDDFVTATELISEHCEGVDLNCGCPQRWAMQEGYGAAMLNKSEVIRDMIRQVRNRTRPSFTVSVKVRLFDCLSKSVELCRSIQAAGASFITVHGRTVSQRAEPVNVAAIREIAASLSIPVIANGGVKCVNDVHTFVKSTNAQGVMVAQGLLSNPALFSGAPCTPLSCVQDWVEIAVSSGVQFQCLHHHLVFMLEKILPKELRRIFNKLSTKETVLDFLEKHLGINVHKQNKNTSFNKTVVVYGDTHQGKFFRSKVILDEKESCENESEMYLEDSIFSF